MPIGGLVLVSGRNEIGAFANHSGTVAVAGLPLPAVGGAVAFFVEAGCGVLLLLGTSAPTAAIVLAAWCLARAVSSHGNSADQDMLIHFLTNVMIAGGLVRIVHLVAGATSLANRKASSDASRKGALA